MTKQVQRKASQVSNAQSTELVAVTDNVEQLRNSIDLKDLAHESIVELQKSDSHRGKGVSIMTYVMAMAWYNMDFTVTVDHSKKGEPEQREINTFTLCDIYEQTDIKGPDGKKNTKLSVARLNCVALELFTVSGELDKDNKLVKGKRFNSSQLNTFNKALSLVYAMIERLKVRIDQFELNDTKTLCVPYHLFNDKPNNPSSKYYQSSLATYELMQNQIVPINSFDDLVRNIVDRVGDKNKKGTKAKKDPAQQLTESLNFVAKEARTLAMNIETGKDAPAPKLKEAMMNTFIALQKMFEADKNAEQKAQEAEEKELQKKAQAKKTA